MRLHLFVAGLINAVRTRERCLCGASLAGWNLIQSCFPCSPFLESQANTQDKVIPEIYVKMFPGGSTQKESILSPRYIHCIHPFSRHLVRTCLRRLRAHGRAGRTFCPGTQPTLQAGPDTGKALQNRCLEGWCLEG